MPEDRDRLVPGRQVLPLPEDGDRPGFPRDRLDLPRPGELRLGGSQNLVLLAQVGQVGGGEGVVEGGNGDTGTMVRATHELTPPAWSRGRAEFAALSGLVCFGREAGPLAGGESSRKEAEEEGPSPLRL